jgi:succinate dehydrogenase / fumarate reductase flavoprotein subunit
MYHQFKELAEVDITTDAMEVGPTCHYVMGGVEVDPDHAAARLPGLFAAGEVAGGMHGSNRLGGNSLSDLLVFGRRAGAGAAAYVARLGAGVPVVADGDVSAAAEVALAPFATDAGENPYTLHQELQQTMNDLVGIIRRAGEIKEALSRLSTYRERLAHLSVEGHRQFNPGWHLALDLRNMLLVSECVALAALERQESRGGHTREDYPGMDPTWRGTNLICRLQDPCDVSSPVVLSRQPVPEIRRDLLELFDRKELGKYFTPAELDVLDDVVAPAAPDGSREDQP